MLVLVCLTFYGGKQEQAAGLQTDVTSSDQSEEEKERENRWTSKADDVKQRERGDWSRAKTGSTHSVASSMLACC